MLPPNLSVGGWNLVFVGTFLASAIYASLLYREATEEARRLILGFGLICIGSAIRIGGWLPWRAMLQAGNRDLADWWRELATVWTAGGALVMIVGMTVLMWPALQRLTHGWAIFAVMAFEGTLFFLGATGTQVLSHFFVPGETQ